MLLSKLENKVYITPYSGGYYTQLSIYSRIFILGGKGVGEIGTKISGPLNL